MTMPRSRCDNALRLVLNQLKGCRLLCRPSAQRLCAVQPVYCAHAWLHARPLPAHPGPCPAPRLNSYMQAAMGWGERHLRPAASAAERMCCINLYRICRLPLTVRRGGGMLRARMRRVSGAPAACGACLARLASAAQAGPPVPAGPAAVGPTNLVALCQRGCPPTCCCCANAARSADEAVGDDEEREPSPAGGAGRGGRGGPAAGLESAAGALGQQASVAWLKGVAVVGRSRIYSILCSTGR